MTPRDGLALAGVQSPKEPFVALCTIAVYLLNRYILRHESTMYCMIVGQHRRYSIHENRGGSSDARSPRHNFYMALTRALAGRSGGLPKIRSANLGSYVKLMTSFIKSMSIRVVLSVIGMQ